MPIKLTDELVSKTKKGKIASAKQVYLEGDEENLQSIGDKTHQIEDLVKAITVTGGASVASAVTYDHTESGLTAVTAQGAIDELANKNKEQDNAIDAKADKKTVEDSLNEKVDKKNIQQALGDNEDMVPSLKLVKEALDSVNKKADDNEAAITTTDGSLSELKNKVDGLPMQKVEHMTQSEYERLSSIDADTYYMCTEE